MAEVHVKAGESQYDIHIARGLLQDASGLLHRYHARRAVVVCDENTDRLYARAMLSTLRDAGLTATHTMLPAGEETKCMESLIRLYDAFIAARLTRSDVVVALGGGVIGDLTGLAACTFMRGVHFVQVPTTLLSQVDSSVGGKVAINHPQGKNLIGAFFQPEMVLIDCDTLKTLDARQLGAGLGEVVKYGCILDAAFFERMERLGSRAAIETDMEEIVERCCALKAQVVAQDPEDHGVRMILNFGHTLGHALENVLGYGTLLHGEGVSIGMVEAARWGEKLGVTPAGTRARIRALLNALDMPTEIPVWDKDALARAMARDKKSTGDKVHLVLLRRMGEAVDYPIEAGALRALLD